MFRLDTFKKENCIRQVGGCRPLGLTLSPIMRELFFVWIVSVRSKGVSRGMFWSGPYDVWGGGGGAPNDWGANFPNKSMLFM